MLKDIVLRDYQEEAVASINPYYLTGGRAPIVVLPTGAGKSLVLASYIDQCVEMCPDVRIMLVTHVKELIQQDYNAIRTLAPHLDIGIYSAGLKSRNLDHNITVAGIQSIYKRADECGEVHILIVDEAQLIPKSGDGRYRQFIADLTEINPKLKVVGLTATAFRMSGWLHKGEGAIFDGISYELDLDVLIDRGYLVPPVCRPSTVSADMSNVSTSAGEYNIRESADAFMNITDRAVADILVKTSDRTAGLVFCCNLKHARDVVRAFREQGEESVDIITGKSSAENRESTLNAIKNGELRWVVNCGVLTTGTDIPVVDVIAVLRATQSACLWVQICGRGMRLSPDTGKKDCIASGQRVLTDKGLIPIEDISKDMKIWDGVEFVSHDGVIYKGEQEVIEYAGITATPDHKVWTASGWKTLKQCKESEDKISVCGNGWKTIQLSQGYFRGDKKEKKSSSHPSAMCRVWRNWLEGQINCSFLSGWLQKMWSPKKLIKACIRCAKVAVKSLHICKRALYQPEKQGVQKLWSPWNNLRLCFSKHYGAMDHGQLQFREKPSNRSNRQQQRVFTRKHSNGETINKHEQPKKQSRDKITSPFQIKASRDKVCGFNTNKIAKNDVIRRGNRQVLQPPVKQTKRQVWDILNCGSRNRFTCEGLLVSNCLILDYGQNTERLGPLNDVHVREPGQRRDSNRVMAKICPMCEQYRPLNVRICGASTPDGECNYEFPVEERESNHTDEASDKELLVKKRKWPDWLKVLNIEYNLHRKRRLMGIGPVSPPSMRVTYTCEDNIIVNEWVCIEHSGYAGRQAVKWMKEHMPAGRLPTTVQSALTMPWRQPSYILAEKSGKWYNVLEYAFRKGEKHQRVRI